MILLQEAKKRLEEINATLDKEISYYHPVSLYGFKIEKGEKIKYTNSNEIAVHLLLARHTRDIEQYSMAISAETLKIDFNTMGNASQSQKTKIYIINAIVNLVKIGIIEIRFIEKPDTIYSQDNLLNKEFTEDELNQKLKSNEQFEFLQTPVYNPHDDSQPMFFRFYESFYRTINNEKSFSIMKDRLETSGNGVSAKFNYLTLYASIASSLNAPHKEEYIERNIIDKSGINKINRHIELLNASVNFSGQEHLASKTANNPNPKKTNSGIGVDRVNKIDQSLRQDFGIFAHVKVRRYGKQGYKWTIYRCFAHEFDTLKKMLELEVEKTHYEIIKYGEPKENSITDILPLEYLDDQNEYKVAEYQSGFILEEVEENPFAKVEELEAKEAIKEVALSENLNEDKKILPLGQAEEKENKSTFMNNYNTQKPESTQLIKEIWKKISDPRDKLLILKQSQKRYDDEKITYPDAYEVNLAIKTKDYSMINTLFEAHIKTGKIIDEDLENAEIKNIEQKIGRAFAAEQKIVRIHDQQPYEIEDDLTNKLIGEVLNYFNAK